MRPHQARRAAAPVLGGRPHRDHVVARVPGVHDVEAALARAGRRAGARPRCRATRSRRARGRARAAGSTPAARACCGSESGRPSGSSGQTSSAVQPRARCASSELEHRRRGPRPLPVAGDVQDPHGAFPEVAARGALELPELRVLEQHVERGDGRDQEARHAVEESRLEQVGAQEAGRRTQAQVRDPRATPAAMQLERLDPAVLLDARHLIGEIDGSWRARGRPPASRRVPSARTRPCGLLPAQRPRERRKTRSCQSGWKSPWRIQRPRCRRDAVQLDAVELGRIAGEPLAQARRRARARAPRPRRARSPSRVWPGRARSSSARRCRGRRGAARARPRAGPALRSRRGCARRSRPRSRRSRRAKPGSARSGARRRERSRRR